MIKKTLLILAAIIGLILVAVIVLPFVISVDRFRPVIQEKLDTALGRNVSIGRLDLSVARGDLLATDISISDDPAFGSAPFVRAKSFEVGVDLMPLIFSRALNIRSITLDEPQVVLLRSSNGKWNFSSLGQERSSSQSAGEPSPAGTRSRPPLTMEKLSIIDGRMSIGTSPRWQQTYDGVNLTAENVSLTSPFPFTLKARTPGGGGLQLDGQAGPIDQRDAAQTPLQAKLVLKQVDLASTGFLDPSSGLSGTVDYQGEVHSDGKVAHAQGTVNVAKLRVVKTGSPAGQPISVDYASDYNLASQTGQLTKGQILTGKSTVAISGTYDTHGESPVMHMKVESGSIPVHDIQALLPAFSVTLPAGSQLQSGTLSTHLALEGAIDQLVTTGDIDLSNAKLAGFGLGSKLGALSQFAGLKPSNETLIETMSSNLRVAPEGIRADNLKLVAPEVGTITGEGTIGADKGMNFKLLVAATAGGALANLATRTGLGGATGRGIPVLVQGTTSNPVFQVDTSAVVKAGISDLIKQQSPNQPNNLGNILGGILGRKKNQ